MATTGFDNMSGAYLASRICCILVKGGGAAITIRGGENDSFFFKSSTLEECERGESSEGKEF
jgi:hypothetical protein